MDQQNERLQKQIRHVYEHISYAEHAWHMAIMA